MGIALGLHSFSLYIHNDTLEPFEREEDMFRDNGIQLKPVFAISYQSCLRILSLDIKMSCLHKKVILMPEGRGDITICVILMSVELGTGDFIVYHIHAFTIHIALLICMIGLIYPCDGPGRGEDCLFLAVSGLFLAVSVVLFQYFWKMQSDVWGIHKIPTNNQHKLGHHLVCKHNWHLIHFNRYARLNGQIAPPFPCRG